MKRFLLFILPGLLAIAAHCKAGQPEAGEIKIDMGEDVEMSFLRIPPAGLWVARFEVTNKQFKRFDASHVSAPYFLNEMDENDQPVVKVSWRQAVDYTEWMNRRFADQMPLGNVFRLPLEREWAVFAACGDKRIYPWGNNWPPPNNWNYRGEEGKWAPMRFLPDSQIIRGHTDDSITTAPVQSSGSNSWGLCGVGGNAWEWCMDVFENAAGARVIRGASWHNYLEKHLRLAYRAGADPRKSNSMIGFRVVIGKPVPVPADGF